MRPARLLLPLLVLLAPTPSCKEAMDITSAYGFINLVPPSTLYVVGAVLAVEPTGDGSLDTTSLKLVCGPRASLGADFVAVVSQTVSQESRVTKATSWHLSQDMLSKVKMSAKVDAVEDIQVSLTDAKILTLSDDQLLRSLPGRSQECSKAIMARLRAGQSLTMISSSLIADLTYTVKFRSSIKGNAQSRAKEMTAIAVSLGGGHQQITSKQIISKGLVVGIKTDSFLMVLGVPELQQNGAGLLDDFKLAHDVPEAMSTSPDAPVVPPSGAMPSPVFIP